MYFQIAVTSACGMTNLVQCVQIAEKQQFKKAAAYEMFPRTTNAGLTESVCKAQQACLQLANLTPFSPDMFRKVRKGTFHDPSVRILSSPPHVFAILR